MNKIIAVDFDNTLCNSPWPKADSQNLLNKLIMFYVKYRQKKGDTIILWTCRNNTQWCTERKVKVYSDSLAVAIKFLQEKNFIPDYINVNVGHLIDKYTDTRKISADIYIDDKNIGMIGWILRRLSKESDFIKEVAKL